MTENKSITQRIDELTKSTDWFYSDDFTLDEAVKKYKEAIELAKELQESLTDLQNEVEVLTEDFQK